MHPCFSLISAQWPTLQQLYIPYFTREQCMHLVHSRLLLAVTTNLEVLAPLQQDTDGDA